jgi:hypothetical protein
VSAAGGPQAAATAPNPPSDLIARGRGRRFWRAVTGEFTPDPHELELLAEAARGLDLVDRLRSATSDAPLSVDGRTNPLLVELRLCRAELRLLLSQFDWQDGETPTQRRARRAAESRWSR